MDSCFHSMYVVRYTYSITLVFKFSRAISVTVYVLWFVVHINIRCFKTWVDSPFGPETPIRAYHSRFLLFDHLLDYLRFFVGSNFNSSWIFYKYSFWIVNSGLQHSLQCKGNTITKVAISNISHFSNYFVYKNRTQVLLSTFHGTSSPCSVTLSNSAAEHNNYNRLSQQHCNSTGQQQQIFNNNGGQFYKKYFRNHIFYHQMRKIY